MFRLNVDANFVNMFGLCAFWNHNFCRLAVAWIEKEARAPIVVRPGGSLGESASKVLSQVGILRGQWRLDGANSRKRTKKGLFTE